MQNALFISIRCRSHTRNVKYISCGGLGGMARVPWIHRCLHVRMCSCHACQYNDRRAYAIGRSKVGAVANVICVSPPALASAWTVDTRCDTHLTVSPVQWFVLAPLPPLAVRGPVSPLVSPVIYPQRLAVSSLFGPIIRHTPTLTRLSVRVSPVIRARPGIRAPA